MRQFWWVNHNQTFHQEIGGQYLWSPKTESNGARSEFYNNMRRAAPGDLALSYADQAVQYIGRTAEFAFTAPKPEEFGNTGAYWSNEGWCSSLRATRTLAADYQRPTTRRPSPDPPVASVLGGTPREGPAGPGPQPLTAPAVRPDTMRRWSTSTSAISGSVTITDAAMIWPQGSS